MSAPTQAEEQVFSSDEQDLECTELKEKIGIKQAEMLHLINDRDKFAATITDFANLAKTKIELNEKQQLKFALVYLKEAEKILQYAASSGKNITKELIITILHNQSSIYQKLWELNNCSDYLEGIIFNYQNFIRQTSIQGSTISKEPPGAPQDPTKIKMKQKLSRYNLQFCAVSSQLGNHDAAIQAVTKAHALMAQCISGCPDEFKKEWSRQCQSIDQVNMRMNLLIGLANYDKKIEEKAESPDASKNILKAAHFSLQMWSDAKRRQEQAGVSPNSDYLQYLNNYSIGNIVEIVAIKYEKNEVGFMSMRERGSREFDLEFHPFNKLILLSACFFSRATELRLKSMQLYRKNLEQRKFSKEYKLSICYHLMAIIIPATFIPTNLKYLNQILMSYEKHYGVNLSEYKTVEVESMLKMMEILNIEYHEISISPKHTEKVELQLDSKNDYNMKTNFDHHRSKKLEKMKSLKKITKELNDPKRFQTKEQKSNNKSKESKTSFSISKYQKKDRTVSKNQTIGKSKEWKDRDSKDKNMISNRIIPKVKSKKGNQMMKSRQREDKKSKSKPYVDETEELFFCFTTKKTKKSQACTSSNSQLRSTSINSNSGKSKNSKKSSILSPRTMKVKVTSPVVNKQGKSPKRKNVGQQQHYYF